ncbi:MAG: glutathione synthase [Pseudomonadales bacterium]
MAHSPYRIGFWMDPIEGIRPYKDTSFALMLAAQALGWEVYYLPKMGLSLDRGVAIGWMAAAQVQDTKTEFVQLAALQKQPLNWLDCIMIRTDPPFDGEYLYATQILERAASQGVKVINRPGALRDFNEKLFATEFADLMPTTIVSASHADLRAFHNEVGDIILKPLDGMGGAGIFRIGRDGLNLGTVLETLGGSEERLIMAQAYRPEIADGDKRVLVLHGEPHSHALARIPMQGETRGNLAAGGRGVAQPLTEREREIAETVAPRLRAEGLVFVGLDVIGGYLTEINVTSPTCVREIDAQTGSNIAYEFLKKLVDE